MKLLIAALLTSFTSMAWSQEEIRTDLLPESAIETVKVVKVASKQRVCPDIRPLDGLCSSVGTHEAAKNPVGRYRHAYQEDFIKAACVDLDRDDNDTIVRKISSMLAKFEDEKEFKCSNGQFDIPNGNILKFAVSKRFDTFIGDAIRWKVNLNKVDPVDNRTILDYVQSQINQHRGNGSEAGLHYYYDRLRRAGAKHRSELVVSEEPPLGSP